MTIAAGRNAIESHYSYPKFIGILQGNVSQFVIYLCLDSRALKWLFLIILSIFIVVCWKKVCLFILSEPEVLP